MKRHFLICTTVCMLLTACAGMAASDPAAPCGQPEALAAEEYEEPEYEVLPFVSSSQFRSEDEKLEVVAIYNYQTILLSLRNEDAVSPEDAEAAARNIEAFNSKMLSVSEELVEQGKAMAADAAALYGEYGALTAAYEDSVEVGADFRGDIISAYLNRSTYTGGAHPNRYTSSYLFDLEAGQFIYPTQLAEDPEAFHAGAAALLLQQAEAHPDRGSFWQDYADIIASWNEAAVRFTDEGMTVTYSPYELAPYSTGEVALTLAWEELRPLLGKAGVERLGVE